MKRDDNHIKETMSIVYVKRVWADWVVNKLDEDYGIDLDVVIVENSEITDINFPAQLKSTDNITVKDNLISFSIDTDHLIYFLNHTRPFLFIVYDNQNETAYWLIVQDYIWDNLNVKKPNWRNQKYNTLYLPVENEIKDKANVKEAIINSGKRIIQENWYKLGIGDGLGLNDTLDDIEKLEKFEEKTELKTKEAKFILADKLSHQGNIDDAIKKVKDVYKQDKKDLMHLKSVIALSSFLLISDVKQNKERVKLCIEGIELAKELKNTIIESILIILKNKARFFPLIQEVGRVLYSRKVRSQTEIGQLNVIFLDKQFEELTKLFIELNEEINQAINVLIKNEEYYLLIYCLTEVLDIFTMMIPEFKIFDGENEILKEEIENKAELANHLLRISENFGDKELDLYVKGSVASLYYCLGNSKAVDLMKDALNLANELGNKPESERLGILLKQMEENPEPYKKENLQEKLNMDELQELYKMSLEIQGINLNSDDEYTNGILVGLRDANPEKYHKFCDNIYIVYMGANYVGETIGLPSLGLKLIYCSNKDIYVEGTSLEVSFDFLKKKYCEKCEKRSPRDPNWKCKLDWFEKRWQSDMIQGVLKKRYEANKNMKAKST